jgi:hypothetical protein
VGVLMKASLQEYWDMLLLDGFNQDEFYWIVCKNLKDFAKAKDPDHFDSSLTNYDNVSLKRNLAVRVHDYKKPIRALMATRLPKTSTYLWNIYPMSSDAQYQKAMSLMCSERVNRESRGSALTRAEQRIPRDISRDRLFDIHAGHRRRDWSKVK